MNPPTDLRQRAQWLLDQLPTEVLQQVVKLLEVFWQELHPQTKPNPQTPPQSYDFSDLAGQLEWQGDALAVQRSIRDEW